MILESTCDMYIGLIQEEPLVNSPNESLAEAIYHLRACHPRITSPTKQREL